MGTEREGFMPKPQVMIDLYLHLAKASEEQGRPLQRDKFLVLAARIAQKAGWEKVAEDCRRHVLKHNPNHILKRFPTMAEALESDDIRQYIRQLLRIYPFEKAEYLLDKFRASGYSGSHGYNWSVKQKHNDNGHSQPAPKAGRADLPKTNGHAKPAAPKVVRPTLQKALAKTQVKRAPVLEMPVESFEPLPLELPQASPTLQISHWNLCSWLIFSFALGLAIGGAAVLYLNPSS